MDEVGTFLRENAGDLLEHRRCQSTREAGSPIGFEGSNACKGVGQSREEHKMRAGMGCDVNEMHLGTKAFGEFIAADSGACHRKDNDDQRSQLREGFRKYTHAHGQAVSRFIRQNRGDHERSERGAHKRPSSGSV